ncbi:unnamed protein product [Closterium sp. NIES-54]
MQAQPRQKMCVQARDTGSKGTLEWCKGVSGGERELSGTALHGTAWPGTARQHMLLTRQMGQVTSTVALNSAFSSSFEPSSGHTDTPRTATHGAQNMGQCMGLTKHTGQVTSTVARNSSFSSSFEPSSGHTVASLSASLSPLAPHSFRHFTSLLWPFIPPPLSPPPSPHPPLPLSPPPSPLSPPPTARSRLAAMAVTSMSNGDRTIRAWRRRMRVTNSHDSGVASA